MGTVRDKYTPEFCYLEEYRMTREASLVTGYILILNKDKQYLGQETPSVPYPSGGITPEWIQARMLAFANAENPPLQVLDSLDEEPTVEGPIDP